MKSFKLIASLLVAGVLLAACSLIPPIPLGANAVGYTSANVTVDDGVAAAGFSTLAAALNGGAGPFNFDNLEPPDLPMAPATFRSLQGFDGTVPVTGTSLPETITITSGTLKATISDDTAGDPADVVASVDFGPIELNKVGSCALPTCEYSFANASAAAETLTLNLNGKDMTRLISIITDHGSNNVTLTLVVTVDYDDITSMDFTIAVVENYITF